MDEYYHVDCLLGSVEVLVVVVVVAVVLNDHAECVCYVLLFITTCTYILERCDTV